MTKRQYAKVARLVGHLIDETAADRITWKADTVFCGASVTRAGVQYVLDFPSKSSTDRTLFVDGEQAWHGSELNALVQAITDQDRRRAQPVPSPVTQDTAHASEQTISRAVRTFSKKR